MKERSLACFLSFTVPAALLRLGMGCAGIMEIWRRMAWMTSWC
ncbi:hypothetical protein [uncultured Dysosmobacter sp.]|nr:hypothetical protein [uncultured Dysosmobacter sp.]